MRRTMPYLAASLLTIWFLCFPLWGSPACAQEKLDSDQPSVDAEHIPSSSPLYQDAQPSSSETTSEPTLPQPKPQAHFSQQELDQMLAPIALYPDALLSQILMASTYPLEVIQAARWSKSHPELKGEQAVQAVAEQNWDPSVKSLVAFPQVLNLMDDKLDWMERVGGAFLAQQTQVMDAIQSLRQKAYTAGNLQSNDLVQVQPQGETIAVQPVDPQIVYVPYYDPTVVYGPWWWPAYPPVYWAPWPGYYVRPAFGLGFWWGPGVRLRSGFFFGAFNWPRRQVIVVNNVYYGAPTFYQGHIWAHDPVHRHGVPYRTEALRQQFGRVGTLSESRLEFRGHDYLNGHGSLRSQSPTFHSFASPPSSTGFNRVAPTHVAPSTGTFQPSYQPRAHAFEGIGHGPEIHSFSTRGQSSFRGSTPRFSGGGMHSGGGHGRH